MDESDKKQSQLDRDIAAKQRAAAPTGRTVRPGAYAAPPDEATHLDSRIAAKQNGATMNTPSQVLTAAVVPASAAVRPGAFSATPDAVSQLDNRIAAKQNAMAPPAPAAKKSPATSSPSAAAPATAAAVRPGAFSAPPGELSELDTRIAAKQRAARPPAPMKAPPSSSTSAAAPTAAVTAAVRPGAFSAPPDGLSQLDSRIAAKQNSMAPLPPPAKKSPPPISTSAAAPTMVAAVRPGAYSAPPDQLSQLDNRIASKQKAFNPAPVAPAAAMKSPPSPGQSVDTGMQAKEREKQLRRQQISQRSLMSGASLPSPKKSPPSPGKSVETGMQAKEREKNLRRQYLSQRSLMSGASSVASAPVMKSPPSPKPTAEQAKETERQLRKEHLSDRSLMSGLSDSSAGASRKRTQTAEQAKESERKLRKERLSERSLMSTLSDSSCGLSTDSDDDDEKMSAGAEAEADDAVSQKVGAYSSTAGSQVPQKANQRPQEQFHDEDDVDSACFVPAQQPAPSYHLTQQPERAPSYRLTPQPEVAPSYQLSPQPEPLPEEAPLMSTYREESSSPVDPGLNLVEATLVVEEMVEATVATPMEFQPDEVMKIREQSAKETARIRMWRIVVSIALLATAIAVTTSTYFLLVEREDQNFRTVYAQFATTVADAAVDFQSTLRRSLRSFADNVAAQAEAAGQGTSPWPFYVVDKWETLGRGFKQVSNAEFIAIQNYVTHDQRDEYIDFITPLYQTFVKEAHMEAYGNLDFLNNDTANYQPYIAQKLKNGSFVPDIDRDFYFCRTTQSPPARKYGPTINNNLIVNKVIGNGFAAVMKLHNELVFTTIKPFANVPAEEHAKMHSNGAEGANNPHSFTFHPVHRVAGNQSSDIVAMFAVATAWDFSMQNLLPDNVKGMFCVLQNTCNQTVTYRIDGGNATYLGDGDLRPSEFDDMGLFVDLNLQTHPDARSTPGHCMYSMKIYPSKAFESDYKTNTPAIYAGVVAGTFVLIAITLLLYDGTVTQRNEKMIFQAAKTNAILAKFVPDHLRDRIMGFDPKGSVGGERRGSQEFNPGLMDGSKVDEMAMAKSMAKSMSNSRMMFSSSVVDHARRADLDV